MHNMHETLTPQLNPRVKQSIGNIRQNQPNNIKHRAQKDHCFYNGKVLCVDGIYGVASKTRDSEEGLHDE